MGSATNNSVTQAATYFNGVTTYLGTLGGSSSSASAVNNSGKVVGTSATSGGQNHAFLYSNGTMIDLGTAGLNTSEGLSINASGEVVGTAVGNSGTLGFLYTSSLGTAETLDSLYSSILVSGTDPSDPGFVQLNTAVGINDIGEIVGVGEYWNGSALSYDNGYLLQTEAVPEPSSILMLLVGGLGLWLASGTRKRPTLAL